MIHILNEQNIFTVGLSKLVRSEIQEALDDVSKIVSFEPIDIVVSHNPSTIIPEHDSNRA